MSTERKESQSDLQPAQRLRELLRVVPDPRSSAVRKRVCSDVARLRPDHERDALDWIESVSEFDNPFG